jgi:hypothetical protein
LVQIEGMADLSELQWEYFRPFMEWDRRFQQWRQAGVLDSILWALCEDLLARGELGLEETFVDASFAGAKGGAGALVQHAAAKGARLWHSQTATVFLSPSGLRALRRMSPRWSTRRWPGATGIVSCSFDDSGSRSMTEFSKNRAQAICI